MEHKLVDTYIALGSLYEKEGKWSSALAHYRLALKIHPNLAIAHKKLGDLWYKLQHFNKAAESWYRAFSIDYQLIDESPEFIDFVNHLKSLVISSEKNKVSQNDTLLKVDLNRLPSHTSLIEIYETYKNIKYSSTTTDKELKTLSGKIKKKIILIFHIYVVILQAQ
ncbi:tetratricopeptide repeat protein [Arthrospira platensis SPKY2]